MLDTNLLPYPWSIMILALVGLCVCCWAAYYVLLVLWYIVKATIQAFIYQLWSYKKAKINGRTVNWKIFWPTWRNAWHFLLGMDYSKEPHRSGNSFFYGWTFTVSKQSQFVQTAAEKNDADYEDDEDESDDLNLDEPDNRKA